MENKESELKKYKKRIEEINKILTGRKIRRLTDQKQVNGLLKEKKNLEKILAKKMNDSINSDNLIDIGDTIEVKLGGEYPEQFTGVLVYDAANYDQDENNLIPIPINTPLGSMVLGKTIGYIGELKTDFEATTVEIVSFVKKTSDEVSLKLNK